MFTETYVFPSNGLINYVVLIGPDGHPQPIPAEFKEKPLHEVDVAQSSRDTYIPIMYVLSWAQFQFIF